MTQKIKKPLGVTIRQNKCEFRLWAPNARAVYLCGTFSNMEQLAMTTENDGNWSLVVEAQAGQEYFYMIDDGSEQLLRRNDPRARAITASDNGMAIIVDDTPDWSNDPYLPPPREQQIIYEMHIGTFNRVDAASVGTFHDAIARLDHVANLGANMIELMPITSMAFSNGWGYAPKYLYSVESMYGGRGGLMQFVSECHRRNIGVILDVVYNHMYEDVDLWKFDGWSGTESGGGIYFYNDDRARTPWGGRLDYGRPEVRDFIKDNVAMWLSEYNIDGLRIDSTIYMRNTEGRDNDAEHDIPEAWSLLKEIVTTAKTVKPSSIMIAEDCAANALLVAPLDKGGCGFDAQWETGYPHAIRDALNLTPDYQPTLSGLDYQLNHNYSEDSYQKIIYSDSHDSAANGSARLNQTTASRDATSLYARQMAILANTLLLTSPGIPMILQGQELLQPGDFNDWQELKWDNMDLFPGIYLAHQHLIDLRLNTHQNTGGLLAQNTAIFHQDDAHHVIAYRRWSDTYDDDVIVIANLSNQQLLDYAITFPLPGSWQVRFNSSWKGYGSDFPETPLDIVTSTEGAPSIVALAPYGAIIMSRTSLIKSK